MPQRSQTNCNDRILLSLTSATTRRHVNNLLIDVIYFILHNIIFYAHFTYVMLTLFPCKLSEKGLTTKRRAIAWLLVFLRLKNNFFCKFLYFLKF